MTKKIESKAQRMEPISMENYFQGVVLDLSTCAQLGFRIAEHQ